MLKLSYVAILLSRAYFCSAPKPRAASAMQVAKTPIVPLEWIKCTVYWDLLAIYPKPYSIYLRGSIPLNPKW